MHDLWAIERELRLSGSKIICGVDEAGRGPLAGSVCAAAVILPEGADLPGLDDSKKLSEAKREVLFDAICAIAESYGIGWATVEEIDEANILNATYLAMNRAIEALDLTADICLIDGNRTEGINYPNRAIVGGDKLSGSIAAASIIAKVTRDRYMSELHQQYPQYGFDRHRGYPTKAHYAALDEHGASPVHRQSFLRKWYAKA